MRTALCILSLTLATLAGCRAAPPISAAPATETIYTCSMHPQVRATEPGTCPICGMNLVPLTPATETTGGADSAAHTPGHVYIAPDRQRLIGVEVETLQRGPVTRTIRTPGRIAYDPDLMVAQREYVEALRLGDRNLITAAEHHLRHMGIGDDEFARLRRTKTVGNDLFLPGQNRAWVYAPLFENDLPLVHAGDEASIALPQQAQPLHGTVRAIDAILDPQTRSARARIVVENPGGVLRPNMNVDVTIQIPLGEQLTIPSTALLDTGTRQVVIVRNGDGDFTPMDVETGTNLGERIVIKSGVSNGMAVVTRASFLVNAESSLKSVFGAPPTHQHP